MSLQEIFIILLVSIIFIKYDDIPVIIKFIKKIINYIFDIKKQFINIASDIENNISSSQINEDFEEINLYIKKLSDRGIAYEGEYKLQNIKDYYDKHVKANIKNIS